MRLTVPVAGVIIGAYPGRDLLTAEARLASMLAGHQGDSRLTEVGSLVRGAARAEAALASLGIAPTSPATVRRLDLAAELLFPEGADGLALLQACARGLHLPKLTTVPHHATGEARLASIIWQTPKGRQTRLRLYDSGAHHVTHPPGHRLRLEREKRWIGTKSPTPEQAATMDHGALYAGPMGPWLKSSTAIRVGAPLGAVQLLYAAARRGELTRRQAESLSANVNTLAFGGDLLTPHDRRRRERALRRAGITLDHSGDSQPLLVDLRSPLGDLVACWEAGP